MPRLWAALGYGALAAHLAVTMPSARADVVGEFYRGRTVTLVVGYGPGGGYDIYARLLARHLGRFIPGHPTIVVQNMPGGASLRAVNWLYNTAPSDGSTIAHFARNMPLKGMLGTSPNIRFDARRFTWLGSSSSFADDAYILIVRSDIAAKGIADVTRPGGESLVLGGTAEGTTGKDVPIVLRDTIGLNVRRVIGYPDAGALYLAMERGEVNGRAIDLSSVRAARPGWLKPGGGYRVLVQFARTTRHPDLPAVPTARELARNEAARSLIELAEMPYRLSRPFAAPPGVPAARAEALQRAFAETHLDPDYLADARSQRIDVSPVTAQEVVNALKRLETAPQAQLDYLRRLFAESKS